MVFPVFVEPIEVDSVYVVPSVVSWFVVPSVVCVSVTTVSVPLFLSSEGPGDEPLQSLGGYTDPG